ncbi:hypothetical protein HMPREF9057_01015 [Actinomyces sp. oral taxon 171 str. F0337]|nr:hypothetical protein HMPREF9057_01015 [Actinomyces sp. oral taxon 171 str. F0337]
MRDCWERSMSLTIPSVSGRFLNEFRMVAVDRSSGWCDLEPIVDPGSLGNPTKLGNCVVVA